MCTRRVGGIGQDTTNTGQSPAFFACWRRDPALIQVSCNLDQAYTVFQLLSKDFHHDRSFCLFHPYPARVARVLGVHAIAIRRACSGQQDACTVFTQPSTPLALCNQCSLIFGDRTTNLQQELVMWILADRPVQKFHLAVMLLQFFDQQDLMDIFTRQTVRCSHENQVEFATRCPIPQTVQTWTIESTTAETIITKDISIRELPALSCNMRA